MSDLINCREEFLSEIGSRKVKCAEIYRGDVYVEDRLEALLPDGYTTSDFNDFLSRLNFEYDPGYGGQEVFGIIWYEDGTWSERGEYDGAEWWNHKSVPDIPERLLLSKHVDARNDHAEVRASIA